jgi:hypothetical protein
VTCHELNRRRRSLEREIADIDRELMPLCAMHVRSAELQERRRVLLRELDQVLDTIARLRGDCPRPLAVVATRRR